jgi:peptidoglycan/LPS O-acetylase OafA/YrhL
MSRAPDRRMFYTIDGLRGIAALLVVCRHIVPLHGNRLNFPSSYLAVELFFLFSGFVIAHAYDKRFEAGMGFWEFAKARLIRLYPLYLLGFAVAVLTVPGARLAGLKTWPLDPGVIVPNLFMLPTYVNFAGGVLFPFNNPSWTLFFELLANFAYCLLYRFLTHGRLALLVIVTAVLLIVADVNFRSLDIGYNRIHFIGGFARVAFSFFAGVAVYRFQLARPCPIRISPWLLLAGATGLLVQQMPRGLDRELYDAVCAVVVFPLFAYLATAVEPGLKGQKLFMLGGGASYALYLIHAPLGGVLNQFFTIYGRPQGTVALGVGFIAAVSVIAVLAERYYDRPVRRWITGLTGKRPRDADRNPVGASSAAGTSAHRT